MPTVATVGAWCDTNSECHVVEQQHECNQCPAGLFHLCPFFEFSPLTITNRTPLRHVSHQDDSGMYVVACLEFREKNVVGQTKVRHA